MSRAEPSYSVASQSARDSFDRCPGIRRDTTLQLPAVNRTGLEHVDRMIGFDHDRVTLLELLVDQRSEATEIHQSRETVSTIFCDESEIISRVVRNPKRFKIDIADSEVFVRFDCDGTVSHRVTAESRFFLGVFGFAGSNSKSLWSYRK